MSKKILSIDGGGVRGIIPAYICMKIEEDYGKPIHNIFDFISGTSTGAILGAALASGIPAEKIFQLYLNEPKRVFKSQHAWYLPWRYITRPKYNRDNLMRLTNDIYGNGTKIADTKVHFMCTSYNSMSQKNEFFTSWDDKYKDLLLVNAVGRSWSAPFYFGKWIEDGNDGHEKVVYSDGGVGIYNNTTIKTLMETSNLNWNNEDKYMLNLGCGHYFESFTFKEAVNWMNIKELWHIVFNAKDARDNQIENLQKDFLGSLMVPKLDFHNYDPHIRRKIDTLDGVKYIDEYLDIANNMYKDIDISVLLR